MDPLTRYAAKTELEKFSKLIQNQVAEVVAQHQLDPLVVGYVIDILIGTAVQLLAVGGADADHQDTEWMKQYIRKLCRQFAHTVIKEINPDGYASWREANPDAEEI